MGYTERAVSEILKKKLVSFLLQKGQELFSNTTTEDQLRRFVTALMDLAGEDAVNFGMTLTRKLREVAEYLERHHKQIKITRVVGSGLALGGSVLAAVAVVASPLTVPFAGVCMVISGVGGLFSTAAFFADVIVNEGISSDDPDRYLITKLFAIIKTVKEGWSLRNTITRLITFVTGGIKTAIKNPDRLKEFGLKATIKQIIAGAPMTPELKKLIEVASKEVGKKLFFLNIAMIPLNAIEVYRAFVDLREGEKSTFCKACLLLADLAESAVEDWIKCNEKHWDGDGTVPPSQERKNENQKQDKIENKNKREKENESKIDHPIENDNKNHNKTNFAEFAVEDLIKCNEKHGDGDGTVPPSQERKNENQKQYKIENENKREKENESKIDHPIENDNKNHNKTNKENENTNGSENENKIENKTKNECKYENKTKSENQEKNENDRVGKKTRVRSQIGLVNRTRTTLSMKIIYQEGNHQMEATYHSCKTLYY